MPTFRNVSSSSYDGTGHQITPPAFTALRTPLDVQINALTTSATFPNVALPSEIANLPAPDAKSSGPRRSHSRRKDPNHIPRPRNCFLIFRSEFIAAHKYSGIKQQTLSVEAALRWKKMEEEERQVYEDLALREKMAHTLRHPNYVYSPTRKGNSVKAKPSGTKKTASSMSATVRKRSQLSFSRSSSFTASSSDADSSPELEVVALTQTLLGPAARNEATRITRKTASSISTIVKKKASRSSSFAVSSAPSSDVDSSPELEVAAQQAVWRLAPAPSTPSERPSRSSSFSSPPPSKHDNFVPTDEIPVLSLTSKTPAPILVTGRKVLETSYVSSIHPHLDTESILPNYFYSGPGYEDGFKSYLWQPEVMYDTIPVLPPVNLDLYSTNTEQVHIPTLAPMPEPVTQTGPPLYLPYHDEFALPANEFLMDYTSWASSSTSVPHALAGFELDSELEPIARAISALDLSYDYGMIDRSNLDLAVMEESFLNLD